MATIRVWRGKTLLAEKQGPGEIHLLFTGAYQAGDELEFIPDAPDCLARVDAAVPWARVYAPEGRFRYRVPIASDNLAVYAPGAFAGERHLLGLTPAQGDEYRNLAANPADQRGDVSAYPHATANVETRNESAFCARNAIDGEHVADGHGQWPWGSWGIGERTDAYLTVDFGREVRIDALTLYLRADFPHDAYWVSGVAAFSDGSEVALTLRGVDGPQRFAFPPKRVRWVRLERLVKCDHPSAFPALRQIEVWGRAE